MGRRKLQQGAVFLLLGCAVLCGTDAGRPQPEAVATDLESRDDCQPEQVHLALTGDPTEMRVSWKTAGSGCGARLHSGLDNGGPLLANPSKDGIMPGEETTYSAEDMCSLPASGYDFEPPHLHTEVLTGLVPGEKYQYRIGGHEPLRSFRAAPKPDPNAGFKFIVYGDMGESDHKAAKSPGAEDTAENVKQEIFDKGADMVLHVGDISYANGDVKIWDTFMRYIEQYASAAPYMIAVGNHEYDYRTGGEHHKKHHRSHPDASGSDQPYDPD